MSNEVFPSLPGLTWPQSKTPVFNTQVQTSDALRNWRVGRALYPQYKRRLVYSYLSQSDYETMAAFFKKRRGRLDSFLFEDRDDYLVATPQVLGTGDGVQRSFQLLRALGGFVEPVGPVKGTPVIRVNGTPTLAYTIDDWGLLTLDVAAPAGHVVDWTGQYYWRYCFSRDESEFSETMRQFWELRSLDIETDKP